MSLVKTDLGAVTNYAYAVEHGYFEGTEEEYNLMMTQTAQNAQICSTSAESASADAETATIKAAEAVAAAASASAAYGTDLLADDFTTTKPYEVGEHVIYNGGLWVFDDAHEAGEWLGTDAHEVQVGPELTDLKSAIDKLAYSNLSENLTVVQDSVILWNTGEVMAASAEHCNAVTDIPVEGVRLVLKLGSCTLAGSRGLAFYNSDDVYIGGYKYVLNQTLYMVPVPKDAVTVSITTYGRSNIFNLRFEYDEDFTKTTYYETIKGIESRIETSSNLAKLLNKTKIFSDAIVSSYDDNTITVSGTAEIGVGRTTPLSPVITLPAGTYTLRVIPLTQSAEQYITRFRVNVTDTEFNVLFYAIRDAVTYTFESDTNVYITPQLVADTTYEDFRVAVMLNAGDVALNFMSYYGGPFVASQSPLRGKHIVIFGDSRTWYDGQAYNERTKEEWTGKTCVGYQNTLERLIEPARIVSEGGSGNTSARICERIRAYDFSAFDAVLLEGGVNDWIKGTAVGNLMPVGSDFDTTSVYGAWQSAIEYILSSKPSIKIFMDVPAIAWDDGEVYPRELANIKAEVAKLYNIPCKDMYGELGINEVNRNYFYCDDVDVTGWHLHFNDYGNALFGTVLAEFMSSVCGDQYTYSLETAVQAIATKNKNLAKLANKTITVGTGVTVTSTEDGKITYNGVSSGTTGRTTRLSNLISLPAGTYTISAKTIEPEAYRWATRLNIYVVDSANNTIVQITPRYTRTFTLETATSVYISTTVSANTTCSNISLLVMLNEGNQVLEYDVPALYTAVDTYARGKITDKVTSDKLRTLLLRNYVVQYANAENPLDLVNCYGTIQNVHPKVLYFENLFAGHRYWMAYTPYTNANVAEENPCIAYSDDGFEWTNIEGNPIEDVPEDGYYSDTHLVYREDTGMLECWYRLASTSQNLEKIYRKTSLDGITWSSQELLFTSTGSKTRVLSPAVIWDSTMSVYRIWVVSSAGGYHVDYYESPDALTWTKIREIGLTYEDSGYTYYPWHIDVEIIGSTYCMLVMCKHEDDAIKWPLFMATSADNETYTTPVVVIPPNAGKWDDCMYRSCLVKTVNDYRIYYSARKGGVHGMAISVSDTLGKFIGSDLLN